MQLTAEQIKAKIEILQKDLAMLTEGSVASDTLEIEIYDLKLQLQTLKQNETIKSI